MQKLILTAALTAALALPVLAGTHKVPDENSIASVTIPDDWKVDEIDDGVEAVSDDGEVYIAIEETDAAGVGSALEESMKYLKSKGVTVDSASMKQQEGKLNGMDVINIDWDGKDEDGAAKISLSVISTSSDKGLILIYWASPEGEKKNAADLEKIANSIKKV